MRAGWQPAKTTSRRCGSSPHERRAGPRGAPPRGRRARPAPGAAALRRSRARVIEAADAERRRVGRDLHDGAQQRLMAVGNLLKLAQRKVERDDGPSTVLRLACDELGEAQAELRDLARGLHPVALSERGLRSALETLTVGSDIPITLDVGPDELPDDLELAAYFIVSESLTNATKYADAGAIR